MVWTFATAEFECKEVGQFPDPNDPQVFYICIDLGNGKLLKQQYRCEKGKIYDRFSHKCVDDGLGTSTVTTSHSTTPPPTTTTQTVPTITQTTPAPTKTTTKTGVTIEPDEFHCPKEGYYPNPKDKHEFYQCVNGGDGTYKAYKFRCDPHTEYDPDLKVCKLEVSTKKPQLQMLKINSNYAN